MENFLIVLLIISAVIAIIVSVLGLQGLIFWGIGSFVCWAFAIPFTFTFWHGLAIALILSCLEGLFTINIKKEDKGGLFD